jgi:hypothetical protein
MQDFLAERFLLDFHIYTASQMAHKVTETNSRPTFSLNPARANETMCVLELSALQVTSLLQDPAISPCALLSVKQQGKLVQAVRHALDNSMLRSQQCLIDKMSSPIVNELQEQQKCSPLSVCLPGQPTSQELATLDAPFKATKRLITLVPQPTYSASLTEVHEWMDVCEAQGLDGAMCDFVSNWLFGRAVGGITKLWTHQDLQQLVCIVTKYRQALRRLQAEGRLNSRVPVELRSCEVLALWLLMCWAHCTVRASWADIVNYSLPVNPDALRLLVLSDATAVEAALAVAEYMIQFYSDGNKQMFSLKPEHANGTLEMAACFAQQSEGLKALLEKEMKLVREREEEHWRHVQEKQQLLHETRIELQAAQVELGALCMDEEGAYLVLQEALLVSKVEAAVNKQLAVEAGAPLPAKAASAMPRQSRQRGRQSELKGLPVDKQLQALLMQFEAWNSSADSTEASTNCTCRSADSMQTLALQPHHSPCSPISDTNSSQAPTAMLDDVGGVRSKRIADSNSTRAPTKGFVYDNGPSDSNADGTRFCSDRIASTSPASGSEGTSHFAPASNALDPNPSIDNSPQPSDASGAQRINAAPWTPLEHQMPGNKGAVSDAELLPVISALSWQQLEKMPEWVEYGSLLLERHLAEVKYSEELVCQVLFGNLPLDAVSVSELEDIEVKATAAFHEAKESLCASVAPLLPGTIQVLETLGSTWLPHFRAVVDAAQYRYHEQRLRAAQVALCAVKRAKEEPSPTRLASKAEVAELWASFRTMGKQWQAAMTGLHTSINNSAIGNGTRMNLKAILALPEWQKALECWHKWQTAEHNFCVSFAVHGLMGMAGEEREHRSNFEDILELRAAVQRLVLFEKSSKLQLLTAAEQAQESTQPVQSNSFQNTAMRSWRAKLEYWTQCKLRSMRAPDECTTQHLRFAMLQAEVVVRILDEAMEDAMHKSHRGWQQNMLGFWLLAGTAHPELQYARYQAAKEHKAARHAFAVATLAEQLKDASSGTLREAEAALQQLEWDRLHATSVLHSRVAALEELGHDTWVELPLDTLQETADLEALEYLNCAIQQLAEDHASLSEALHHVPQSSQGERNTIERQLQHRCAAQAASEMLLAAREVEYGYPGTFGRGGTPLWDVVRAITPLGFGSLQNIPPHAVAKTLQKKQDLVEELCLVQAARLRLSKSGAPVRLVSVQGTHRQQQHCIGTSEHLLRLEQVLADSAGMWYGRTEKFEQHVKALPEWTEAKQVARAQHDLDQLAAECQATKCKPLLSGPPSKQGTAWYRVLQAVCRVQHKIEQLESRLQAASLPPPDLIHALPDARKHKTSVLSILFFSHPEFVGAMPELAYFCLEAAYMMLPEHGHSCWRRLPPVKRCTLWNSHLERQHQAHQAYVPQPDMLSESHYVNDQTWLQLAFAGAADQLQARRPVSNHVEDYDLSLQHGVCFPEPGIQLVWYHPPCSRKGLSGMRAQQAMRVNLQTSDAVAAMRELFVDSGPISQLAIAPSVLGPSKLVPSTTPVEPATDEHKKRSNTILASQALRPSGLSQDAWMTLGQLRAYPMTQLPLLCAALQEGALSEVLDDPDVRSDLETGRESDHEHAGCLVMGLRKLAIADHLLKSV